MGSDLLSKWTGQAPVAHRAGAFGADLNTMEALIKAGIPVDSSLHPHRATCRLSGPENQVSENGGVVEVPILGFNWHVDCWLAGITFYCRRRFRPLNLDGCSAEQLQWFLAAAKECGIPILHLTLHSYSFIKWDSDFRSVRWNPVDHAQ